MNPYKLLGIPYRLGADPQKHKAADCLSLTRTVLAFYNINFPKGKREWYRRFLKGDRNVFKDELAKWGFIIPTAKLGTVALCLGKESYALAVYWENGWISFVDKEARWSPVETLGVQDLYYPMKQNFVMP